MSHIQLGDDDYKIKHKNLFGESEKNKRINLEKEIMAKKQKELDKDMGHDDNLSEDKYLEKEMKKIHYLEKLGKMSNDELYNELNDNKIKPKHDFSHAMEFKSKIIGHKEPEPKHEPKHEPEPEISADEYQRRAKRLKDLLENDEISDKLKKERDEINKRQKENELYEKTDKYKRSQLTNKLHDMFTKQNEKHFGNKNTWSDKKYKDIELAKVGYMAKLEMMDMDELEKEYEKKLKD